MVLELNINYEGAKTIAKAFAGNKVLVKRPNGTFEQGYTLILERDGNIFVRKYNSRMDVDIIAIDTSTCVIRKDAVGVEAKYYIYKYNLGEIVSKEESTADNLNSILAICTDWALKQDGVTELKDNPLSTVCNDMFSGMDYEIRKIKKAYLSLVDSEIKNIAYKEMFTHITKDMSDDSKNYLVEMFKTSITKEKALRGIQ